MFRSTAFLLCTASAALFSAAAADGPFTDHFINFLKTDPNANQFVVDIAHALHSDEYGSFGGKINDSETLDHLPVVFIHGNSDYALHRPERKEETGWTNSVQYFKKNGYHATELYGLTYGTGDIKTGALNNSITCEYVKTHRYFIESVLKYTQSPQLDIVAHSMGVTIARMVIQGGTFKLDGEVCELGESLTGKVRSLVSIAGAHYGMCLCLLLSDAPSCGPQGFSPGTCNSAANQTMEDCLQHTAQPTDTIHYSSLLLEVNKRGEALGKEAEKIFSIYSEDDPVLGPNGNLVWGRQTSAMPGSDLVKPFNGLDHFGAKDETAAAQYEFVSGSQ